MMDKMLTLVLFCSFAFVYGQNLTLKTNNPYDDLNGLDPLGDHVCSYQETITVKMNESYLSQRFVTIYRKTCFILCTTKSKLITRNIVASHMVTKYVDRNVYQCCSGWVRSDPSKKNCDKPVCSISCKNGGTCVGPNKCKCQVGYSGKFCQIDDNECANPKINNCEHECTNRRGGFYCGCYAGYQLQSDGKSCKDINECNDQKTCGCAVDDGVCQSTCVNNKGSYHCKCPKGYTLNSAELCEDRNECFETPDICDHKCVNTPSSYECRCFNGYKYNAVKSKCEDINECSVNNGGCSDSCININGTFACTCPTGKYLSNDRKSCQYIDLSTKNDVFCQSGAIGMIACDDIHAKINIKSVFYGRSSTKYCPSSNVGNLNCVLPNAEQQLLTCNGVSTCLVLLDMFPDPCPTVEKYARVTYTCEVPKHIAKQT